MAVDGHRTQHGQLHTKYEDALQLFLIFAPKGCFDTVTSPTGKMLSDRFKKILSDHRLTGRYNAAASGIIEFRGEREVLTDDFVLQIDERSKQRRVERDEKTEFDKGLQNAGEEMRDRALNRGSPGKEKSSSTRQMGTKKQKRRAPIDPAFAEQRELLIEHVQSKAEIENKRLKLDEDRLDFERWKGEEDAIRVRHAQDHEAKVLALNSRPKPSTASRRRALRGGGRASVNFERKHKRPERETSMVATTRVGWATLASSKHYTLL